MGRHARTAAVEDAELLDIAVAAARAAADELLKRFGSAGGVRAKSTPTDLVSDADLAAESAIRRVLAERRPGDAILGEEGGSSGAGELRWVVDPLDGTVNYLFGIPVFAVSVACEDSSGTRVGVVLDPLRNECFSSTRSGPPSLNGSPLDGIERASELSLAMVATGFSYDAAVRAHQAEAVGRVLPRARDIRRAGSAALDLCWCACGRYDAFYERGLNAWDVTAGLLIASRAGLEARQLAPVDGQPEGVLVAPEAFVDELVGLVIGDRSVRTTA
jgi:myo-inositol-1(or 4)-monophosphatase